MSNRDCGSEAPQIARISYALTRALHDALQAIVAPGIGLPTWGYLFAWSEMPTTVTVPSAGRLLDAWLHTPKGIARLSEPDSCNAIFRRFRGLPMSDVHYVVFDVARFAGGRALYFGFDRGALAAGAVRLELGDDGLVRTHSLWVA